MFSSLLVDDEDDCLIDAVHCYGSPRKSRNNFAVDTVYRITEQRNNKLNYFEDLKFFPSVAECVR